MSLFDQVLEPTGATPLRVGACDVFVGTCSWADRTVIASDFYPRGTKTDPRRRLQHYSTVFPTVEIDASYHALQPIERAHQWLEWTPSHFRFCVKAFAWLTWHESDPRRLPPEIATLLPEPMRAARPIRGRHVPEEALTAAWDHFAAFTDVFAKANRLGYVLFQFPKAQGYTEDLFTYLDAWTPYLRGWPVAIEIRHREWLYPRYRDEFLGFLRSRRLAYVIPDMAQAQYLPPPDVELTADWSVVRFHGRSPALLARRARTDDAYDYLYSAEELDEWAGTARRVAERVGSMYLMFNNHARGQAAQNGQELQQRLGG